MLHLLITCTCSSPAPAPLRAAPCTSGSEGGEANLRRLLDKAAAAGSPGAEDMAGLAALVARAEGKEGQEAVTAACQTSLGHLHHLLGEEGGLGEGWLAMVVAVVVTLVARLRGEEAGEHRRALCQAWLLALLSHLAQRAVAAVGKRLWGAGWTPPLPALQEVKVEEEQPKKRRNKLEELLRRRRRSGSGSEGDGGSGEESGEEGEGEIYHSDESEDELSSRGDLLDGSSDSELDVVVEEEEEGQVSEEELVEAAEGTGLLPGLLLCLAWLADGLAEGVLAQTGPGSDQLWTNLAALCSVLGSGAGRVAASARVERARGDRGALPEDWLLRGLVEGEVEWSEEVRARHRGAVRVGRLEGARRWLCAHTDSKIAWSEEQGLAYLRQEEQEKQERESKKEKMKHMAELWLRQEVRQLEEEVEEGSRAVVVVDGSVMAQGLAVVRRAVGQRRGTVVVPAVAVQQLDFLKKKERGAREAIRFGFVKFWICTILLFFIVLLSNRVA